jgi:excisionase family DNA binding protein
MNKKTSRRRHFDSSLFDSLRFFDVEAIYRFARIAKRTIYAAVADGRLPAYRAGGNGKLLVKREDLERFLTATPATGRTDKIVEETLQEIYHAGK